MDKEAFLHQLESSIANNDKKLFIDIIFDLPTDVIVSFTQEQFSHIISISNLISLQQVDELFDFLESEGTFFLKNALNGIDELDNSFLSKFYYNLYVSLCKNNKWKVKRVLVDYAIACNKLAELGVNSKENLEIAICLYEKAKEILLNTSADYAIVLINESNARTILAEMGVNSRKNLEVAIHLCKISQEILPKTSADYACALMNEGNARLTLAEMGVNNIENFETAICLYGNSNKIFPKKSMDYALALMVEGSARQKLAEIGVNSKANLEIALNLFDKAKELFSNTSIDYACVLMNEGNARLTLAKMGIAIRENLETSILLYTESKKIFPKESKFNALVLMNEGNARQTLAKMSIKDKEKLETAICLYETSRKLFPKTSEFYALSLVNESSTRLKLAEMDIDRKYNLKKVFYLFSKAKELFSKTSTGYAWTLAHEGNARLSLAEMGIDNKKNLERSKKLYLESISILEELEDGWTYSIVLLNLNLLLRNNFYLSGEKRYLEEWERNISGIEEKIKYRDIMHKELLMARIHEIRASLLEFEGKSGINKASREYGEAYNLSNDIFYNFMDEFCQARADNKSFCELVSDWEQKEKEDIFLDYYDYAVFECHLENALKKSIVRKKELELARRKLEEIGNRTQIKIITDRVSAYVFLMNSLDLCFEQGSYEDAAENVLKAYNIFLEFDDKPGCEMCECFNDALLENQNPEPWRVIIQKIFLSREFTSNFYRLLCNYSDRKRTSILQDLPLQTFKNTIEIKRTLYDIQKTLDKIKLECVSIKYQIGKGFKGTDTELQKINEKIDSFQQSLEHLIQISDNVDGKEGECIREFASQMLELVKKGDYESLKRFSEKIVQNSSSIEEIIEAANIPEKEKAEAKSKLVALKKIPEILKEKAKSFSVDVTKDVIVTLASGEIIKLLTPVLSTAILGVPVPSQVVEILREAIRNS